MSSRQQHAPSDLIPCVCLYLSAKTMASVDKAFGHCPMCHGTAACTWEDAQEFAEAWRFFYPEDFPQEADDES